MKRILITGGNGYLGSKLALALKEKGHEVEIFDAPKDIRNKAEIEEAVKGKDIVYHLAAVANLSWTDAHPEETFDINANGTKNVADACAANKAVLNFTSTCCIYGEPFEIPSTEDGLINPTDCYAASKAAGEWIVKAWNFSKGLTYNILRLGTVYGPGIGNQFRTDTAIPIFLLKAIKGEKLPILGTGKEIRNYIYIDDLIEALVMIAESQIENETINIAGTEQISVFDIARVALKLTELPENHIEFHQVRKNNFKYQFVSIKKVEKLLGWHPKTRFEQGMAELCEWIKIQLKEGKLK